MSMLVRYRKQGGFQQLLTLLETSLESQRENLLAVIQSEDPSWAALLKTKLLTVERVFSWEPGLVRSIVQELDPRSIHLIISALPPKLRDRALHALDSLIAHEFFRHSAKEDFTAGDVHAAQVKLITLVREMDQTQRISLQEIDPALSDMPSRTVG